MKLAIIQSAQTPQLARIIKLFSILRDRGTQSVALKFLISNQIIDEFVAILKEWKIIFDSDRIALNYIRT